MDPFRTVNRFRLNRYSWGAQNAVQLLMIFTTVVFLIQQMFGEGFLVTFGLIPRVAWSKFYLWQFVTYVFLHANLLHLALNMYALWVFGRDIEQLWGFKAFLKYYFLTGIGAGIIHTLITPQSMVPTIGASGAVMGILTAFAVLYPDREIFLLVFFILPVRMKAGTMVLLFGGLSLVSGALGSPDHVAHFAHLGGMAVGWLYLKRSSWFPSSSYAKIRNRWKQVRKKQEEKERVIGRVNQILDKANRVGMDRLNWREKRIFKKASEKLRRSS